jgi:hypothetical protein
VALHVLKSEARCLCRPVEQKQNFIIKYISFAILGKAACAHQNSGTPGNLNSLVSIRSLLVCIVDMFHDVSCYLCTSKL